MRKAHREVEDTVEVACRYGKAEGCSQARERQTSPAELRLHYRGKAGGVRQSEGAITVIDDDEEVG
ncbi:hypothetical protein D3C87_1436940 [compost metagenome]